VSQSAAGNNIFREYRNSPNQMPVNLCKVKNPQRIKPLAGKENVNRSVV